MKPELKIKNILKEESQKVTLFEELPSELIRENVALLKKLKKLTQYMNIKYITTNVLLKSLIITCEPAGFSREELKALVSIKEFFNMSFRTSGIFINFIGLK